MSWLTLSAWLAPIDRHGLARDGSGRALARASYGVLLASSSALVAMDRGVSWLGWGCLVAIGAALLDRLQSRRPSALAWAWIAGFALACVWGREFLRLAESGSKSIHVFGALGESFWIAAAFLALLDKNWNHLCGLVLSAAFVGLLGAAFAVNATIFLALLALLWTFLFLLQRAQRWRSAALLGREGDRVAGLDHGAAGGVLTSLAQGFLASWLLFVAALLAVLCYLVLPTQGVRLRDDPALVPEREAWRRIAGFAEGTSLGSLGDLKQNFEPAIIVRAAEPDDGALIRELMKRPLFWRGLVHATYDAKKQRWLCNDPMQAALVAPPSEPRGAESAAREVRFVRSESSLHYEQEYLLSESRVIFALEPVHAVELDLRYPRGARLDESLRRDADQVLWCVDETGRGTIEEADLLVLSSGATLSARQRRAAVPSAHPDPRYLAVPRAFQTTAEFEQAKQRFAQALGEAEHLTGARNIDAVEKAIASALHSRIRYSLNLLGGAPNVAEPLLLFLEGPDELRQGHCLFFASAAALLLREQGISTRLVTGFAGGIARDDKWILAAANAHAWIEIYCEERGWVTMDPTPSAHRPEGDARDRVARRAEARIDAAARDRAFADAELEGSHSLFVAAQRFVEEFNTPDLKRREQAEDQLRSAASAWGRHITQTTLAAWPILILIVGGGLVMMVALRLLRRERTRRAPHREGLSPAALASARIYDRCLDLIARTGVVRQRSETPREFAARAADQVSFAILEVLIMQTRLFERTRYGERELRERERIVAEARLRELERLVRISK